MTEQLKDNLTAENIPVMSDEELRNFLNQYESMADVMQAAMQTRRNRITDTGDADPVVQRQDLEKRVLAILRKQAAKKLQEDNKVNNGILTALRETEEAVNAQQVRLATRSNLFPGQAAKLKDALAASIKTILNAEIKTQVVTEESVLTPIPRPMNISLLSGISGPRKLRAVHNTASSTNVSTPLTIMSMQQKLNATLSKKALPVTPVQKKSSAQIRAEKLSKINAMLAVIELIESGNVPATIALQIQQLSEIKQQLDVINQIVSAKQNILVVLNTPKAGTTAGVEPANVESTITPPRPNFLAGIVNGVSLKSADKDTDVDNEDQVAAEQDPSKKVILQMEVKTRIHRLKNEYNLDAIFKSSVNELLQSEQVVEFNTTVLNDVNMRNRIWKLYQERQKVIALEEAKERAKAEAEARRKAQELDLQRIAERAQFLAENGLLVQKSSADDYIKDLTANLSQSIVDANAALEKAPQIIAGLDQAIAAKQAVVIHEPTVPQAPAVLVAQSEHASEPVQEPTDLADATPSESTFSSGMALVYSATGYMSRQYNSSRDSAALRYTISRDYNAYVSSLLAYTKKVQHINEQASYFWQSENEFKLNTIRKELEKGTVYSWQAISRDQVQRLVDLTVQTIGIAKQLEKPSQQGFILVKMASSLAQALCNLSYSIAEYAGLVDKVECKKIFADIEPIKNNLINQAQNLRPTP